MYAIFVLSRLLNFTSIVLQEPHNYQTKDLGSVVELSAEHLFMATASNSQLKYQWSRIINNEEEKFEDEECFKNSDSNTLVIDGFESKYAGTYRCVISATNQLVVSMSAEMELRLPGKLITIIVIIPGNTCFKKWVVIITQNLLKSLVPK